MGNRPNIKNIRTKREGWREREEDGGRGRGWGAGGGDSGRVQNLGLCYEHHVCTQEKTGSAED
jgi:hypothetical protein